MRTPLNAAFLGLKLVIEELKEAGSDPGNLERLDTLNDVSQSVSTTVEILNDLLCFGAAS
jgi:hypothetical protein